MLKYSRISFTFSFKVSCRTNGLVSNPTKTTVGVYNVLGNGLELLILLHLAAKLWNAVPHHVQYVVLG